MKALARPTRHYGPRGRRKKLACWTRQGEAIVALYRDVLRPLQLLHANVTSIIVAFVPRHFAKPNVVCYMP